MRHASVKRRIDYLIVLAALAVSLLILIFVKSNTRWYATAFMALIFFVVSVTERKRSIPSYNRRTVALLLVAFGFLYVAAYYISGLYFDFYLSLNSDYLNTFVNYSLPIAIIIVLSELTRRVMLAQEDRLIGLTSFLICVVCDLIIAGSLSSVTSFNGFLDFAFLALLSSISANLLFRYLAKRYGVLPNILYRLITVLYAYIIPYKPNLENAILAFAGLIVPIVIYLFIDVLFEKKIRYAYEVRRSKAWYATSSVAIVLMALLIMLVSCQFRYGAIIIATESMTGEINKGDAVIFEQYDGEQISVGDVIIFESNSTRVVHRVVKIDDSSGQRRYYTKGDANSDIDAGYVTESDMVGIVHLKVSYVGYPTLWLRSLFMGNN